MKNNLAVQQYENYSYQHIQGCMLGKLNKLAYELNLSHTAYRVMGTLIGLWSKEQGLAFPSIAYLSRSCNMSKSTVIRSLKRLEELKLIVVVKNKGKINNYHISNLLFEPGSSVTKKTKFSFAGGTTHDTEQIKRKTNKTSIEHEKKNNDVLNKFNFEKLNNSEKIIRKHSIEKVKNLINIVEVKKESTYKANLRALNNASGVIRSEGNKILKDEAEVPLISERV